MSDEKRGAVTNLWMAAVNVFHDGEQSGEIGALGAAAGFLSPEGDTAILAALDAVAGSPEIQEVVRLIQALPAEARSILPDVLRGLGGQGQAALMAVALGEPITTSARVAAWAGGLNEDALAHLEVAIEMRMLSMCEHGSKREADAMQELMDGLRAARSEPEGMAAMVEAEIGGSSYSARMAVWAGKLDRKASLELYASAMHSAWDLRDAGREDDAACLVRIAEGLRDCLEPGLDLGAERSFARRRAEVPATESKAWRAGAVPPVLLAGMVKLGPDGTGWKVLSRLDSLAELQHPVGRTRYAAWSQVARWVLAEDFDPEGR